MELIVFWITSIVLSFVLELKNDFRIIKDVADLGYKFNIDRLSELKEELNPGQSKQLYMLMLIPIVNILESMRRVALYNNNKTTLMDTLDKLDLIEEMDEFEKAEYLKKPTGFNAIITPLKIEFKLENAKKHIIYENGEEIEIFYEFDKDENINILKVNGTLSNITSEDLKEIIINDRKKLLDDIKKHLGSLEEFINKKEEDNNQSKKINEEKNELIKLKNEIMDSVNKEEKGPILSKRKDKLD